MTSLWTIGYERLLPAELASELQLAGVRRLLDVRYRPQSRRPGMSKTRLAHLLAEQGIAYEHRRALGTPPEIRVIYRRGASRLAAQTYREHLLATGGAELERLEGELETGPPTALLCLEADPAYCHRSVICEELLRRRPGLEVIHL